MKKIKNGTSMSLNVQRLIEILQSKVVSEYTPGAGGVEKESGLTVGT